MHDSEERKKRRLLAGEHERKVLRESCVKSMARITGDGSEMFREYWLDPFRHFLQKFATIRQDVKAVEYLHKGYNRVYIGTF